MKILKYTLSTLFILILLSVIAGGINLYLEAKEDERGKAADLAYKTENNSWTWQYEYQKIQVSTQDGETRYRKVDRENNLEVIVHKRDQVTFSVIAIFYTECEPGTEIDTGQTFSSGAAKKLVCTDDGDSLVFAMKHTRSSPEYEEYQLPRIDEDLGGFEFSISLSDIDFTKRDRELTLANAVDRNKDD